MFITWPTALCRDIGAHWDTNQAATRVWCRGDRDASLWALIAANALLYVAMPSGFRGKSGLRPEWQVLQVIFIPAVLALFMNERMADLAAR